MSTQARIGQPQPGQARRYPEQNRIIRPACRLTHAGCAVRHLANCFARRACCRNRCQVPGAKIFRFSEFLICRMMLSIPPRCRGTYRGRHDMWGGDAVDVKAPTDERRSFADGEVVWSWRAHAGAKSQAKLKASLGMTVANAGSPRRSRISRKPSRREGRCDHRLYLWFSRSRKFLLRGSPGCSGHPAFPAPSDFRGG